MISPCLAIVLLALGLRLGAVFATDAHRHPALWEYEVLAGNLLAGRGFVFAGEDMVYRSYAEPLYPFLLYAIYAVTEHSFLAVALVQVALSTALVVVVDAIGRATAGPAVGLGAALLVALDPGLIRYTVKFHVLVLDALLLATVVLLLLEVRRTPRPGGFAALGLALGLGVLSRPTVLGFVPVALAWMVLGLPGLRLGRRLALIGLTLAVAAAVLAPWVVRNQAVHGRFVLTRVGGGFVFWLGNHPGSSGSAVDRSGQDPLPAAPPALREAIARADEAGRDEIFRREAFQFVREDPVGFVGRTATKLFYFWWFSPQSGLWYAGEPFWIYRLFYLVAAPAAAAGMVTVFAGRLPGVDRVAAALVLAFLLSMSVTQSVFYVEGRHRLGVEGVFLIFSAAGLWRLGCRWHPQVRRYAGWPAGEIVAGGDR